MDLKILLYSFRTAQLKVLTQTIESLQLNASSSESSSLELIKRVVELSAELSAQTAAYGLVERKVLELEGDRTRKSKVCSLTVFCDFQKK